MVPKVVIVFVLTALIIAPWFLASTRRGHMRARGGDLGLGDASLADNRHDAHQCGHGDHGGLDGGHGGGNDGGSH